MKKVSVLVPVYNVELYLEQCLSSIIGQTLKEIEIICVDDGSTDRSGAILDEFAAGDDRITVIHKENSGYGSSMNRALAQAAGKYIAIVESDDFAEPDMLEKLYREAEKQQADVVKGNHINYCKGKDSFCNWLEEYPKGELLNVSNCPQILNLADTIWTGLYRRDFLERNHICFHETPGASFQDISFALQVWLCAERVFFMQDGLLHYRNDNFASSMHSPGKAFCVFSEYAWVRERCGERLKADRQTERYFTAYKYRDYFSHYQRAALPYQYAVLERILAEYRQDKAAGLVDIDTFVPWVWEALSQAEEDMDGYYRKSAKRYPDPRLSQCGIRNDELYAEALFAKVLACQQTVIYGAGKIGKLLADAILQRGGRIACFAVTHYEEGEKEYRGIPIRELHMLAGMADTALVMIAVAEQNQFALYQNLQNYHFHEIYRVDTAILEALRR